jgi:predicted nucleic acid-binding protein
VEKAHQNPSSSVKLAIVDTSVYVSLYRSGQFSDFLLQCDYLIRGSSVVLAELGRGARTKEERDYVRDLSKRLRLVTPTERDWLRSGEIVRKLSHKHSFDVHKTREIHFDTLIALSARSIGGTVITANGEDFERIQEHIMFGIVIPS